MSLQKLLLVVLCAGWVVEEIDEIGRFFIGKPFESDDINYRTLNITINLKPFSKQKQREEKNSWKPRRGKTSKMLNTIGTLN